VASVARIFRPGVKFDNILITVGKQGIGKSYILHKLGRDWFSDSLTTVQGKEAFEQLQGAWIVEMAELSATRKAEAEAIKHFLSKQEDIYRVSYGRHVSIFPRQCVFFGTTNDTQFLKDKTGNRRFWPVTTGVRKPSADLFKDFTQEVVDQVWAEAVDLYNKGESLYLDREIEDYVESIRETHTEEDPFVGVIQEYLEKPITDNWDTLDVFEKSNYINGDDLSGSVQREFTCVIEIWCEAFRGNKSNCSTTIRRDISAALKKIPNWEAYERHKKTKRFREFGPQKAYCRKKVD